MSADAVNLVVLNPETKRDNTVKELFTSELIYVNNLRDIMEGLIQPLRDSLQTQNPIVHAKIISGIFSNIESIFSFHEVFLSDIEKRISQWHEQQSIGDIFLQLSPYLKLYTQYCSNYDYSINLVQLQKKTNPSFQQFLVTAQSSERFKGAYISSLLILPIQRIPRYEMFLKELVKLTSETHPDRKALSDAFEKVSSVAEFVNEACVKAENMQKIIEIGKKTGKDNLLTPGRWFNREDNHQVVSYSFNGTCTLYLFNDAILVQSHSKSMLKPPTTILCKLELCWIEKYEGNDAAVQLVTPNDTHLIIFDGPDARENWEKEATNLIEIHVNKNKKFMESRSSYTLQAEDGIFRAKATEKESTDVEEKKSKRKYRLIDWKEIKLKKKGSKIRNLKSGSLHNATQATNETQDSNRKRYTSSTITKSNISKEDLEELRKFAKSLDDNTIPAPAELDLAGDARRARSHQNVDSSARDLRRSLSFMLRKEQSSIGADTFSAASHNQSVSRSASAGKKESSKKKKGSSVRRVNTSTDL